MYLKVVVVKLDGGRVGGQVLKDSQEACRARESSHRVGEREKIWASHSTEYRFTVTDLRRVVLTVLGMVTEERCLKPLPSMIVM